MNETYDKSCNLNRSFEDDLKNRDNSLNSISSSIYPDRQFDGISFSTLHELRTSNPFRIITFPGQNGKAFKGRTVVATEEVFLDRR